MTVEDLPKKIRTMDAFHHIDLGFLNRRLCLTALLPELRDYYREHARPGDDHTARLSNDHLLITMLLDLYQELGAPTLLEALALQQPKIVFRSTERLVACPNLNEVERACHEVKLDLDFGKPVVIAYHTSHLITDTGKMALRLGWEPGYVQSMVGLLHNYPDRFEIEPIVIGAPWFDHPRNADASATLMWAGQDYGEILPEDIDQFSEMAGVQVDDATEWMAAMKTVPEADVKAAIAALLTEPTKKDWGGESNDHFSSNVVVGGARKTAAFLLKGPSQFREMTLDMCGARADQIYRLVRSDADISVVQHSHLIGEAVRGTLRGMVVRPGGRRKYCLMDGQATYRLLKAYGFLPKP
jgi:hypothetical protein